MINVEKHGTVARLLILNYQMVIRMAHRYFHTTNVYHGFSILVCHGLQKSTMVYKRPPWSTKVYLGVQRSTMVYKSLPWSTEVQINIGIEKRDRDFTNTAAQQQMTMVEVFEIQMQDAPIM